MAKDGKAVKKTSAIDFLTGKELSPKQAEKLLDLAVNVKKNPAKFSGALKNKTLAMLFQKTSTRTRMSFEAGMTRLGGHAIFLDWRTTNLALGALKDEVKSMERYSDILMARVFKHEDILAIAEASSKPVINGLCDKWHPCQALADYLTVKEKLGKVKGKKIAFVGDGNNVCNSLIVIGALLGAKVSIATPKGFEPSQDAVSFAKGLGAELFICNDASLAAKGADVVYTDTWVSMGQEADAQKKNEAFKPFQVTREILGNAYFMHCLPAHRGYEMTDEVIDSPKSIVFDQAENRMHAQNALILWMLGKAKI
ncbi:MAG: ornithine carbamoyltransferase [Candidatus Diapherotrites archaeon]|nr:ornithine carbamoyltransferase [Candidatus Diapherotrites archaeon]